MNSGIILDCGCARCGAASHTITVEYFAGEETAPTLDVVLTCDDCDLITNGFLPIANLTVIED
jgi:hypothetical protein